MNKTKFENLKVYQLAEELADTVWDIVIEWDYFAKDTIGKQLIRACDSIGANVAEGIGRFSLLDNRRFVRIARGSLYETKHWLRRSCKRKLLNKAEIDLLYPVTDELTRVLAGYLRSLTQKIEKTEQ